MLCAERKSNKYQFYSLWFDPIGAWNHYSTNTVQSIQLQMHSSMMKDSRWPWPLTRILHCKNFNRWSWPLTYDLQKSIGLHIISRTKYVPSFVKIHWRMLILECSQGCYTVKIWPSDFDLWPWKSMGFQIFWRTKYVPSLVKIHWRMLIFTRMLRKDGWTDSCITISLRNFVGEGIITHLYKFWQEDWKHRLYRPH
jgi:hypothetical protein